MSTEDRLAERRKLEGEADIEAHYSITIEEEELDTVRYQLRAVKKYTPVTKIVRYEAFILFDEGRHSTPFDLQFSSIEELATFIRLLEELKDKWRNLNHDLMTEGDTE